MPSGVFNWNFELHVQHTPLAASRHDTTKAVQQRRHSLLEAARLTFRGRGLRVLYHPSTPSPIAKLMGHHLPPSIITVYYVVDMHYSISVGSLPVPVKMSHQSIQLNSIANRGSQISIDTRAPAKAHLTQGNLMEGKGNVNGRYLQT